MANTDFRICSLSGHKIFRNSELLIRWNIIAALATLAVGGLMGILVVFTRWPSVHFLPADLYYRFLTGHGINALLAWIIFFEMALVAYGSTTLLGTRYHGVWAGWLSFALMLIGGAVINVMVVSGKADVMFTSYVPLKADPIYYIGVILFAVGALVGFIMFFVNVLYAKKEGAFKRSLPLGAFGLAAASIIGVLTLLHGAGIFVPTLLWSLDLIPNIDPSAYRLVFWGLGHSSQQINVCAMVAVWYMVSAYTVGGKPVNEKLSRTAFVLYILFINVASEHHLLVDPVLSTWHKIVNTSYMMHLAVLASMIHAFAIPASIEVALRKQGYRSGLFEWFKKAPWGNPAFSAIMLSIVLFGFLGGITGVIFGTEQFNIIRHNTIAITGHFHGTVVAGTTIAFMGITYLLIPFVFKRQLIWKGFAQIQPYLYGAGVTMLSIGMMSAGSFGVPRRHWDISFSQAPFSFSFDPAIDMFMTLMGVGGVLAGVGGVLYIAIGFGSIIWGKEVA